MRVQQKDAATKQEQVDIEIKQGFVQILLHELLIKLLRKWVLIIGSGGQGFGPLDDLRL